MIKKSKKKRIQEIEKVYRTLGLESDEICKYIISLGSFGENCQKEKRATFIEAGTSSCGFGELKNAGPLTIAVKRSA